MKVFMAVLIQEGISTETAPWLLMSQSALAGQGKGGEVIA